MAEKKQIRTERFAELIYQLRWFIILAVPIIIIMIGYNGIPHLTMNTSLRIWFNEGSPDVVDYDQFKKKFSQDDALLIAFQDEKGIFNNDAIAVIQRLTKKLWQTKYIIRVDSLTNYSHIYVDGDSLEIKDLIKLPVPAVNEISDIIFPYITDLNTDELTKIRNSLFANYLTNILPYSKEKISKLMNSTVSKADMLNLVYETLKIRLPLNQREFKDFIHLHITKDTKAVQEILSHFFPSKESVNSFFLKYVSSDPSTALKLTDQAITKKINAKELIAPYIKKQTHEPTPYQILLNQAFPHIARKLTTDDIAERLMHLLDKLAPDKKSFFKLISPFIKEGTAYNILTEALQAGFPPYYEKKDILKWLSSQNLTQKDIMNLSSEIFIAQLPLTTNEVKDFISILVPKNNSQQNNSQSIYNQFEKLIFYSKDQLENKKKIALQERMVKDLYISENGKVAQIIITPKLADFAQKKSIDFLNRIKEITVQEQKRSGYHFHIGGLPQMLGAFLDFIKKDYSLLGPLMIGIILLTLLYLFRSVWGVITPILVVIFTIIGTLGTFGFIRLELNSVLMMVPQILLAIGIADAVHILTIFFRELHDGKTRKEAMIVSLKLNFLPCFLTSITTAFGFLSLLTSIAPPIRTLGLLTAFGSLLAFIITITLLPALLSVLPFSKKQTHHKDRTMRWTEGLGKIVINYRKAIFISTIIITLVFTAFIPGINVDNHPVNFFKKGSYIRTAMDFIDEHLAGTAYVEVDIDSGEENGIKKLDFLSKVEGLQNCLEKRDKLKVTKSQSLVDILKTLNQRLNQNNIDYYKLPDNPKLLAENLFLYIQSVPYGRNLDNQLTQNQDAIRLTVRKKSVSSKEHLKLIKAIKEYCRKNMPTYKVKVTGRMTVFTQTIPQVVDSMLKGLVIALLIITITLIIALRSVKIGLLSIIPNVIPMLLMFGLVGITGIELNLGVSMVAAVALGIVVDDTVHFISKYLRANKAGKSPVETVHQVFHDVGSAIIFTSLILMAGFGIFVFSSFGFNDKFGLFTAFTMMVALFVDILFLPSLLLIKK